MGLGRPCRASDRTVGPIFAPQPQVRASEVRVFFLKMATTASMGCAATASPSAVPGQIDRDRFGCKSTCSDESRACLLQIQSRMKSAAARALKCALWEWT